MPGGVAFTAIARPNVGGVLLIEVPVAIVRKLGDRRRPPVRVTLNGVEYRSTIAVYGGRSYLPARKEIRDAAKLEAGKRARVTLALDTAPTHGERTPRSGRGTRARWRDGGIRGEVLLVSARARAVRGAGEAARDVDDEDREGRRGRAG